VKRLSLDSGHASDQAAQPQPACVPRGDQRRRWPDEILLDLFGTFRGFIWGELITKVEWSDADENPASQ